MSSVYPPGRYGRRRQPGGRRRWLVGLLAVLGAAVGLAVGGQLYRQHGNPPYQPTVVGATLADGHATVRFRVNTPAGQGAVFLDVLLDPTSPFGYSKYGRRTSRTR